MNKLRLRFTQVDFFFQLLVSFWVSLINKASKFHFLLS